MRYEPVAYTWFADIYCAPCGKHLSEVDPEGNEKHPVYGWEMSEFAGYGCGECHEVLA